MSITNIKIKNCKSIKYLDLNISTINCLIGMNGAGKSTVMKIINYFYKSLTSNTDEIDIKDKKNPFNDTAEITLTYNLAHINIGDYIEWDFPNELNTNISSSNDIIKLLKKYANKNQLLHLKLVIDKKGVKTWYPKVPFEIRNLLKNLFPVYYISARELQLTNWNDLWNMIGEIGKPKDVEFNEELHNFFEGVYGEKYSKTVDIIKEELRKNNIVLNKYNITQKFLSILQLQLGGDIFKFNYTTLDYFSDGMNSYNYLNIFSMLVERITKEKLKNPLVIYDEPEIGLHPKYIDKLMKKLIHNNGKPQIIIGTHSPRVLKNLFKSRSDYNLFHISDTNSYSNVTSVKSEYNYREKNILNDLEASLYFSSKVVFVEGDTELELFSNVKILELFNFLEEVDFFAYDSDDGLIGAAHPKSRNYNVPYLILVDGDLIYQGDPKKSRKIQIIRKGKKYLNPLNEEKFDKEHNKEKYNFGDGRKKYKLRKRISEIEKFNFSLDSYYKYYHGDYFKLLKQLIREYSLYYNVFPVETTIEGTIVNGNNVNIFKEWLLLEYPCKSKAIKDLFADSNNIDIKSTIGRLIVMGKYENQKKFNQKDYNLYPIDIKKKFMNIDDLRKKFDKTSGWVTEWFEYVFHNHIDNSLDKRKKFKELFPELYDIIYTIENLE